jgi:regulator of sirC expression with transglutaminase-like and TPR domain
LTKVIELVPDNAYAYRTRGYAYAGKKDYLRAIADVEMFVKLMPNHPWVNEDRQKIEEWRRIGK